MNIKKMCVSVVAMTALAVSLGSAARAQDSVPKMQVFGGYSFGTNNCFGGCFDPGLHGYTAAFTYNFNRHLGLEANFSGHNGVVTIDESLPQGTNNGFIDKVGQDLYVYTFGPRLSVPVGNFSLFSHILVGATHVHAVSTEQCLQATGGGTCFNPFNDHVTGNGFAGKFGGGVDWNHRRWGIRILEVDYIRGQIFTTTTCASCNTSKFDGSGNAFELATGVTFNFGGMK